MLIATVFVLRCTADTLLPADMGHAVYAEALAHLEKAAPGMGEWVKSFEREKPLTCSDLLGGRRKGEKRQIAQDERCTVRLTGLSEPVSAVLENFLREPPLTWELGRPRATLFETEAVVCDPQRDGWSGVSSVGELTERHLLFDRPPERKIGVEFASPVSFKSYDKHVPIPMPGLVFDSLMRKWNAFAALPLSDQVKQYAEMMVAVSHFSLHSEIVNLGRNKQVTGGRGSIEYECMDGDRDWIAALQMLADFAFFSGVGVKTTMGMGMCRRATERR